jgi:hypothetical protein
VRPLLLLCLLSGSLTAQVIQPEAHSWTDQWVFGLSGYGGLPVGDFRKNENGGGGIQVMTGFQPFRRQPLVLRADFSWLQYGAVYANGLQDVCDDYSCWTEFVRYQARSHGMMTLHGGAELMATDGKWRPFALVLGGWTWFQSSARVPSSSPFEEDQEESLFSSQNTSTAFGLGLRRVSTLIGREAGFELSTRLTRNPNARYVNEGGVTQNPDGSWTVTPREGRADVVGIHIGFWFGPRIRWDER